MNGFSTRLKVLGATGILAASLGVAAVGGAFAAPHSVALAASPSGTPTASSASAPTGSSASTTGQNGTAPTGPRAGRPGFGFGLGGSSLNALATFLGMNAADLQTALHNHQTLAQIAQAHGKSTADLKTFLTNQLKTQLDSRVSSGKLTSAQETTILNNASSHLDQLINGQFPAGGPRGPRGGFGFGLDPASTQTIATTLGVNVSDLRTELQSGKTLAQIAQEHGKTAADVETALLNAYKARLDQLMNKNFQRQSSRPSGTTAPAATPTSGTNG